MHISEMFVKRAKMLYGKLFPSWHLLLKRECDGVKTLLDVGCGYNSPAKYVDATYKVGVDLFEEYVSKSRQQNIHSEYVIGDVMEVKFDSRSFDVVFSSEVIEHLEKNDGFALLKRMEGWAKKKVVITTPNGFVPQHGYDSNSLQEHKSGWTVNDLNSMGYRVHGINGFKFLKGEEGRIKYYPKFFWRVIADASNRIVYFFPRLAFQLFAVKEIKE